jgi:uncharacterized protein (DUF1330 family)
MPAYVITEITVTDPEKYKGYMQLSPGAVAKYGGRFVVRGGRSVALEGGWQPQRVVVVEFPSLERAEEFYRSPEYKEAIEARTGAATMRMIAVEGV